MASRTAPRSSSAPKDASSSLPGVPSSVCRKTGSGNPAASVVLPTPSSPWSRNRGGIVALVRRISASVFMTRLRPRLSSNRHYDCERRRIVGIGEADRRPGAIDGDADTIAGKGIEHFDDVRNLQCGLTVAVGLGVEHIVNIGMGAGDV